MSIPVDQSAQCGDLAAQRLRSPDVGSCTNSHDLLAALRRTWKDRCGDVRRSPRCWRTVWSKTRKAAKAAAE
jgi:hypothetical protein